MIAHPGPICLRPDRRKRRWGSSCFRRKITFLFGALTKILDFATILGGTTLMPAFTSLRDAHKRLAILNFGTKNCSLATHLGIEFTSDAARGGDIESEVEKLPTRAE
jgi:hypothetical protein